jgi:DNA (cytosine-5)-methyltransferase 1
VGKLERINASPGTISPESANSTQRTPKPQVLSFFCGAGGLDLGFSQAGFDVIFAADYDSAAVETHNANVAVRCAKKLDLLKTTASEIKIFLDTQPGFSAPVGIIGGPPCQGFSRANTRRAHDDPRNQLARKYARLIDELADSYPIHFFVFENVPELLATKNAKFLASLKRKLREKFSISLKTLNASDFGVPQNRERVFIVGIRRREGKYEKFLFPEPTSNVKRTVRNAISHLPEPVFFNRSLTPERIATHPNHWTMRPRSVRFSADLVNSGRSLIRLDWDKPSRTVAYGHREIHVHPSGVRRLSIYEAMLLQGFPPTYQLKGNLSQQVTQVSNAVPPPVAKALATKLLTYLPISASRANNDQCSEAR